MPVLPPECLTRSPVHSSCSRDRCLISWSDLWHPQEECGHSSTPLEAPFNWSGAPCQQNLECQRLQQCLELQQQQEAARMIDPMAWNEIDRSLCR